MTPILSYLLKANITLVLLYGFYFLCFRRDTFYGHIRWYLLAVVVSVLIFPLVDIPAWVTGSSVATGISQHIPDMDTMYQYVFVQSQTEYTAEPAVMSLGLIILWCWLAVALFMIVERLFQFADIVRLWHCYPRQLHGNSAIIAVDKDIQPFSFFDRIFLNPSLHSEDELDEILAHEQVHCRQRHTIDNLLAEVIVCLCWFNPAAWLLRRDLKQNLEYYTDRMTLMRGFDRKHYQYSLLRISGNTFQIANHFYFNNLKKRIIMLNKKESPRIMTAKYLLVIPALAAVLLTVGCLQAKDPDMKVVDVTVEPVTTIPFSENNIILRSLNGEESPLFIVDGKEGGNMEISTESIKDMTVLKGETAIRLYGEKAKNGAVLINTKTAMPPVSSSDETVQVSSGTTAIGVRRDGSTESVVRPLYFIDGKEEGNMESISPENIETMTVLKGENAISRYGEKAKNGAIVITTKTGVPDPATTIPDSLINNTSKIEVIKLGSSAQENKPLVVIDGKEGGDIESISSESIEDMTVLGGETATRLYGEKGVNGVVIVTTKK